MSEAEHQHRGKVVSGRLPDPDKLPGEGEKVYNWQCSCGAVGPGRFRSWDAAENDHDGHVLGVTA